MKESGIPIFFKAGILFMFASFLFIISRVIFVFLSKLFDDELFSLVFFVDIWMSAILVFAFAWCAYIIHGIIFIKRFLE